MGDYLDSAAFAAECETGIIYENAHNAFVDGNYEDASRLFDSIPDGYLDSGVYIRAIAAYDCYQSSAWLDAAREFESVYALLSELYETEYRPDPYNTGVYQFYSYSSDLANPLAAKFGISGSSPDFLFTLPVNHGKSIPDHWHGIVDSFYSGTASILEAASKIFGNGYREARDPLCLLFYESLFRYYEEQMDLGKDITELDEYPFGENENATFCAHMLKLRRVTKLEMSITDRGLREYYDKQDTSICPVAVSGNGIYLNGFDSMLDDIHPNQVASSPENVRYVLNSSLVPTYAFTYNNGTVGYRTTLTVVLKDVSTGEILFTKRYNSGDPPRSVTGYGVDRDTYASATHDPSEVWAALALVIDR